jgi:Fe-S-cluster containining protein
MTPLGASFQCTSCGDCCRQGWSIHVDARVHRAISDALTHFQPGPGVRTISPVMAFSPLPSPASETQSAMIINKRLDGACVFLDSDNLCYLHKHFGPALKPQACRTYPFRPVLRPGAVYAPVSLSCGVLTERLSEMTTSSPGLLATDQPDLASLPYDRYSPGAHTLLSAKRKMPVEVLVQVEERLVGLLHDDRLPPALRLLGMRYAVDSLLALGEEVRITPRSARAALDQALGPDLGLVLPRATMVQQDLRLHLALLMQGVQTLPESVRTELLLRQAAAFGLDRDLPGAERDALAAQRYEARLYGATSIWPVFTAFLTERVRASNLTLRFGLSGTVQAVIWGAALITFFACAPGELEEPMDRADLMRAITEVDLYFFHNVRAVEALLAGSAEGSQRAAEAEQLLLPPLGHGRVAAKRHSVDTAPAVA